MHRRAIIEPSTTSPLRRALDDACGSLGRVANDWVADRALRRPLDQAVLTMIEHAVRAVALIGAPGSPPGEIADSRGAADRAARDVTESLRLVYEQRWAHPRSVLAAIAAVAALSEHLVAPDGR